MAFVSILMSVFNGELHVARAINSLQAQTHRDWELLVVDDGSTDGTRSVLETLAATDRRIRVLGNSQNRGLAASLNLAFANSTGEFIARMDADDRALEPRFEAQLRFLVDHPSVDVLGTAAYVTDSGGRRIGITTRRETHEEIVSYMYRENPFIHPSVMLRRHFLEELHGYDESYPRAQDADLWLRGYRRFRYHNLLEPLLDYRRPVAKMTWLTSISGARALLSEGVRERKPLHGALFASRLLVAYALSSLT